MLNPIPSSVPHANFSFKPPIKTQVEPELNTGSEECSTSETAKRESFFELEISFVDYLSSACQSSQEDIESANFSLKSQRKTQAGPELNASSEKLSTAEAAERKCSSELETSFVDFLKSASQPTQEDIEYAKIQEALVDIYYEFARELHHPNPQDVEAFSKKSILECSYLFKKVFISVFKNPKFLSRPLKTPADIQAQLTCERKFLDNFTKIQKHPVMSMDAKMAATSGLIQKGQIKLRSSKDGQEHFESTMLSTPIIKLFSELLVVRGMITDVFDFSFTEPCFHNLLVDFYLKNTGFDPQTFNFDMSSEDYLLHFGSGFLSLFCKGHLLDIYNQFSQSKDLEHSQILNEKKEALLAIQQKEEQLEFEKKFLKELTLERRNVLKIAENSCKSEFQTFLNEMFEIFRNELEENKDLSIQKINQDFMKFQILTFCKAAEDQKNLFFIEESKKERRPINTQIQELNGRQEISQQRLKEIGNLKRSERKQKEILGKIRSFFHRKMMYNLSKDLPIVASNVLRLKDVQVEQDSNYQTMLDSEQNQRDQIRLFKELDILEIKSRQNIEQNFEQSQRNQILLDEKSKTLEIQEKNSRQRIENDSRYSLHKSYNPYGEQMPKFKFVKI